MSISLKDTLVSARWLNNLLDVIVVFTACCVMHIYATQKPRRDILSILAMRETGVLHFKLGQEIKNMHKTYHES